MSTTIQRTDWALELFTGLVTTWTPPALREYLAQDDERVRSAIRAIAPETDEARHTGWAVYQRTPDLTYDRERPSGLIYTQIGVIFERLEQAQNVLESCRRKRDGDFVICELKRVTDAR